MGDNILSTYVDIMHYRDIGLLVAKALSDTNNFITLFVEWKNKEAVESLNVRITVLKIVKRYFIKNILGRYFLK